MSDARRATCDHSRMKAAVSPTGSAKPCAPARAIPRSSRAAASSCSCSILAFAAPWIAPKDPLEQDLILGATPPFGLRRRASPAIGSEPTISAATCSRALIYGSRVALTVAFVAASLAAALGATLGLLAGWYRGWVDVAISRLVEIWMAFPPVLAVDPAGRGGRRRRRLGDRRDRHHRLDALLPRRARRDDGAGAERLRHRRPRHRLSPDAHPDPRNLSRTCCRC